MEMGLKKGLVCFAFVFVNLAGLAQNIKIYSYLSFGISFQTSTLVNSVGIFGAINFVKGKAQISAKVSANYNFSYFGFSSNPFFPELRTDIGAMWGFGQENEISEFQFPVGNFMAKSGQLGYFFSAYFDKIGTTQQTGTVFFEYNGFGFVTENDILGQPASDKFRSGGGMLYFRKAQFLAEINLKIWHGNASIHRGAILVDSSNYPARFGYKNLENTKFGKFSHGILSATGRWATPSGEQLHLQFGDDAEQIRHFFQNKLLHDLPFVPTKIVGYHNPHYPMLCPDGSPYLFEKNQKIRPQRFYFSAGNNCSLFY